MSSSLASVWWHPHHVEYAFSLTRPQHWPPYTPLLSNRYLKNNTAQGQVFYVDPEGEEDRLLCRMPQPGVPTNRDVILNQPHPCPAQGLTGFHGSRYLPDGRPYFIHEGPKKDPLYWYERNVYQPRNEDPRLIFTKKMTVPRDLDVRLPPCSLSPRRYRQGSEPVPGDITFPRFQRLKLIDDFKRKTHDGVGYL